MRIAICEWCNKIVEYDDPEWERQYERDKDALSLIDFMAKYMGDPMPHHICAECLHKILDRDGSVPEG